MVAFTLPVLTVFYQGQVASGAQVYAFQSGTTTPITTYSDAELTTPNPHPIVADQNGQVTFFIGATTAIRLDLYTSNGDFIKTIDPIYPAANYTSGGGTAETEIVAAATTDLGSAGSNIVAVSGNTAITSLGTSASVANPLYYVRFSGTPLLTHNSTSLILPGSTSIQVQAGDSGVFQYLGGGNWKCVSYQFAATAIGKARGFIGGLTLSNNVTTPNTVLDIAAGICSSSDQTTLMTLSAMTKNCNAAWAVGSGNGALDSGSSLAVSTWYHVYLIQRTDTGVVDALLSTSATAPTMPTNYTKRRRIGAIRTNGSSQIIAFTQIGNEFLWATPLSDVNVANLSTTATLYTLTVPTGLKVNALFRGYFTNGTANTYVLVNSPDETSVSVNSPVGNITACNAVSSVVSGFGQMNVRTNTSGQIRAVATNGSSTLAISTHGWIDPRGALD